MVQDTQAKDAPKKDTSKSLPPEISTREAEKLAAEVREAIKYLPQSAIPNNNKPDPNLGKGYMDTFPVNDERLIVTTKMETAAHNLYMAAQSAGMGEEMEMIGPYDTSPRGKTGAVLMGNRKEYPIFASRDPQTGKPVAIEIFENKDGKSATVEVTSIDPIGPQKAHRFTFVDTDGVDHAYSAAIYNITKNRTPQK